MRSFLTSLFGPRRVGSAKRSARAARTTARRSTLGIERLEDRWALDATYSTVNDWGGGLQGQIAVKNDQAAVMSHWRVEFDYGRTINNIWDAQIVSHVGTRYVIQMAPWNGMIAPGGEVTFGFQASGTGRTPTNVSFYPM
jgi:cellulase/cellobiase CelA1